MNNFLKNKNISVTGGEGFLGGHLIRLLEKKNPKMNVYDFASHVLEGKNQNEVQIIPKKIPPKGFFIIISDSLMI